MYTSKITGKETSAAKYITELVCLNIAASKNEKLEYGFWNNKPWKNIYKYQIFLAYTLLKEYSDNAIIQAMSDKRLHNLTSLKHPLLIKIIKEYNSKISTMISHNVSKLIDKTSIVTKPRVSESTNKTLLSKLK